MSDSLCIITVVYNNYDILKDFFKSLSFQENNDFHVIIVDSSPSPETIDSNDLPVTIIHTKNLGYAHGVNVGLREALKRDYSTFCVMNNDVLFQSDFVDEIIHSMSTHQGVIIGGKIFYAPGFEYHKTRYEKKDSGKVIWYAGGTVDWAHALTHHVGVDVVDKGQFDAEKETDFITGCLMCFDKEVLEKIGFWDEKYFMYYEDADYCERAKLKNIHLIYVPTIRLWHKNAQSTSGSGSDFQIKTQEKARVRYALKYAPLRTRFHIIKNYLFNNLNSRPKIEMT